MSIERDKFEGPITFCCDECGEINETHCAVFSGALAKVKSRGWTIRKVGDEWLHYCGDCK